MVFGLKGPFSHQKESFKEGGRP